MSFHHVISFESEKVNFKGYMEGLRRTRNMWQQKLFIDATKTATPQAAAEVKTPKKLTNFSSHRKNELPSHYSKLNIAALIEEDIPPSLLRKSAEKLLAQLYGKKPFIKAAGIENWPQALLTELIKRGKKNLELKDLQDLQPETEPLKTLYYSMLKGSGEYNLETGQGYPPLSDFLSVDPKERKQIYFCFASYPVLIALLGKDIAEEILQKEKEKSIKDGGRRVLTKIELQDLLLSAHGPQANFLEIEELLSFSKKKVLLENLSYKDPASGVHFHLPISGRQD
jgi:hypothetical protein